MPRPLLIRADGSSQIGTGHVMRGLALAQAWRRSGGQVVFASAETTPALTARVTQEGFALVALPAPRGSLADANQTLEQARALGAGWVVADGYTFGTAWQQAVHGHEARLLVVDDYGHADHYHARYVLNPNLEADAGTYRSRSADARLLLGPKYALLREEFGRAAPRTRVAGSTVPRVLVTLGGSDPENVTAKVVAALHGLAGIETIVVVGGSNPHLAKLEAAVRGSVAAIHLTTNVRDMPALMAEADLAIAAGGSTVWELCSVGLPMLLLVLAENQTSVASALDRAGAAVNLGHHRQVSAGSLANAVRDLIAQPERLADMGRRARRLVDGFGAARVATCLHAADLNLRRAKPEDCRLLWDWVNDPAVRASAFNSSPIGWDEHVRWYERKLADPRCKIFIGLDARGRPVGQARFDQLDNGTSEIDVSVDRSLRRAGQGAALIRRATDEWCAAAPHPVVARIRAENLASRRAFAKAGFVPEPAAPETGTAIVRMTFATETAAHRAETLVPA